MTLCRLINELAIKSRCIPGENAPPSVDCFHCESCHDPTTSDLGPGQCLVRTLFLSVDPAQVCFFFRNSLFPLKVKAANSAATFIVEIAKLCAHITVTL